MKRFVFVAAVALAAGWPSMSAAQATASGVLTVTATVEGSMTLTFETDASGVVLTGAGSDAATLGFGTISAYGLISTPGVTRTVGASDFTVSSPFGVKVVSANAASASYNLTAALGSADAANTWRVGATTLSTAAATVASLQAYGSAIPHTLALTVPQSAAAGPISKTINFTATAN